MQVNSALGCDGLAQGDFHKVGHSLGIRRLEGLHRVEEAAAAQLHNGRESWRQEENEQETVCKNIPPGDILTGGHLPQRGALGRVCPSPNGYAHLRPRRNLDPLYRQGGDALRTRWRVPNGQHRR